MFGVGLRSCHYPYLETGPELGIDWFEAITENYLDTWGRPLRMLEKIRKDYPIGLHGVGLSLAAAQGLNWDYLKKLRHLSENLEPMLVSDHLCWTGTAKHQLHDLLPFPFTQESLTLVCQNLEQVQDFLKRPILIENISSYLSFSHSTLSESEFISHLIQRTGCKILLDINNVYVSSQNIGFDPYAYLDSLPLASIGQLHLAGHTETPEYLYDTHAEPVCTEVWQLYAYIAAKCTQINHHPPTLIEWDDAIPDFSRLQEEALVAKKVWNEPQRHSLELRVPTGPLCRGHSEQSTAAGSGELARLCQARGQDSQCRSSSGPL